MYIWHLRPRKPLNPPFNEYDCAMGFVIVAPDEEKARLNAHNNGSVESGLNSCKPWLDHKLTTCLNIGKYTLPERRSRVIVRDFNAG